MNEQFEKITRDLLVKTTPRPLLFFDVELTDHCNLNCKSCGSFAPLAEESYLDISEYEYDIRKLSELSGGVVHHINLLGGEPLLHPQINDFMKLTRDYFPIGNINLVTNGLLLSKMNEEFWKRCKTSNITIAPTKYPVNVDYDEFKKKAEKLGVQWKYFGDVVSGAWNHYKIEMHGDRNENHSFYHCTNANECTVLSHGRIFPCPRPVKIEIFNKAFNKNLCVVDTDYINIHEVKSINEIMEFLIKPIPFCRYCNPYATSVQQWKTSQKKIEEWI